MLIDIGTQTGLAANERPTIKIVSVVPQTAAEKDSSLRATKGFNFGSPLSGLQLELATYIAMRCERQREKACSSSSTYN